MKIHELKLESAQDKKRVGRGIGSGYGKTAGRGTKGQNARTGGGVRPGFEGGQNPLAKRLPKKRGFTALDHTTYQVVNLGDLDRLAAGATINAQALVTAGLVKKSDDRIKLLSRGEVTKKFTVQVTAVSKSAKAAIEAAGGTIELVKYVAASKKATRPPEAAQTATPAARKSAPTKAPETDTKQQAND
jgi:large subunit ribosomal protein L15